MIKMINYPINLSLEWESMDIKSIADVIMGQSPQSKYYNENLEGMPFLQGNKTFGDKYPTFELYTTSIKKIAEKGSVLMSVRAPVGDLNIATEDICIGRGVCSLKMKRGENEFLYYLLKSNISSLINRESGTVFGSVNKNDIESFEVKIPKDIETQNQILTILKNIDEKIIVCKQINHNLFIVIDNIFKNYVNDYDDLNIVSLSDNTQKIIRGFNSKYVEESNLINFNQKVNKGTFLEKQHFKFLNEDIEVPKEKFAKKRDVLINSLGDGTVGRPHYYNEDTDNVVVDQHITIIRANEDLIPSTYIYEYLKNPTGQSHLDSLVSGSTGMLMLNISEIRNLKIPVLNKKQLIEFDSIVTPLFDKITKNYDEIQSLSKLRDTLLPKLMSGEIDVSEVNCDLKLLIKKFILKIIKYYGRFKYENKINFKNTKSNETFFKPRPIS